MTDHIGVKVENGVITVNDNMGKETVTIKTCKNINLFINGYEIPHGVKYPVSSFDEIKYTSKKTEPTKSIKLVVSEDSLEAKLIVTYKNGSTYKLMDKPYFKDLTLRAEPDSIECTDKYSIYDIKNFLNQKGVVFGLNLSKILRCINGTDEKGIVVAKGIPSIDDIPKRLILKIDTQAKKQDNNSDETINYRQMNALPSVEIGQVIATIAERIEGNDGYDVYGKKIKKKTIRDPRSLTGAGCKVDGNCVIAEQPGRPLFKNNIIMIQSLLKLQGVNLKTGDINFPGDVMIAGRVEQGSKIRCGALDAKGTIDNSKIVTNGYTKLGSAIINSVLLVAEYNLERTEYLNVLKELDEDLSGIIATAKLLFEKTQGKKAIGTIVEFLLEQRYTGMIKKCMSVITYNIKNGITDSEGLDFIRTRILNMGALNITDIKEVAQFQNDIRNSIDDISEDNEHKIDCSIQYAQTCNIKATGDIIIEGTGCYQTNLYAGGDIVFTKKNSICRGGMIHSQSGNIKINQVGSPASVRTIVQCCNDKGIIQVNEAYANTVFIIGKRRFILKDNCRNAKIYIGNDDTIKCESLKW